MFGVLVVFGCAADVQPFAKAAPPVARDSAGVRIVENTEPQWTRGLEWKLSPRPIVSIDPDEGALERGPLDPAAAFIVTSGQIVLLDGMFGGWNRGLVFDSTGEFVRHLGRKGEGPCEFQQVFGGARYRGDSVAVFDFVRRGVFIMSVDGGCGRMLPFPQMHAKRTQRRTITFAHQFFGVHNDGRLLLSPYGIANADGTELTWYRHPLINLSAEGDSVHPIGEFSLAEIALDPKAPHPYPRERLYTAEVFLRPYNSGIVFSDNTRFEVRVHDVSGALKFIARRTHEPVRLRDEDKRAAFTQRMTGGHGERARARPAVSVEQRIAEVSWPEFKPAHSNLLVDESGNFWLEEYRFAHADQIPEKPRPTFWSVFDRNGAWLGRVEVPGRLLVENIYEDRLIGIWKDEDGVASIRVYRLEK